MYTKMIVNVLMCIWMVHAVAADASTHPAAPIQEATQDLKTEESSRLFNWYGGGKNPGSWNNGYGYHYPNYPQQYPNTGFGTGYPNYNYPNYGYGGFIGSYPGGYPGGYTNGYPGGYPGGYTNGYPGGYGGSGFGNGYSTGFGSGYNTFNSRYRNNQDAVQQTTGRGGYVYK